jgi:DNA polymerase III delta subunit
MRYTDALVQALPKFAKGSGLVLEAQKIDKRRKLWKELADQGVLFEFRDLYEQPYDRSRGPLEGELVQWVVQKSRSFGVALTPESALLLCEQTSKSPGELMAELQRVRDALGPDPKRKPLAPADLRGKLSVGFESTPFELADAVLSRDRTAAFRSLRAIFDRAVRQKDGKAMDDGGKFPFATSWLFQSMAQLHEGRLLVDEGVRPEDVPARVGVRGFPDRYLGHLRKNGSEQLERGLLSLLHCQRESRSTGEDPDVLLERFLVRWFDNALPPVRELEW